MTAFPRGASVDRERSDAARAGFTILELMVALTIGGVAISSIYAIGAASTRVFRQQHDIANAQTSLRMAMDQVKRDIARAGYLGTPDAGMPGQSCDFAGLVNSGLHKTDGTGRLAAISSVSLPASVANPGFSIHAITMFGNYSTSAEYPIQTDAANPNRVIVQSEAYDFRRDFTRWWESATPAFDPALFAEAFPVGRAVALRLASGVHHFDTIASLPVQFAGTPNIWLTSPLPAACPNVSYVSPLNAIRYSVQAATGDEAERFAETSGPVQQLVRTEVAPVNKTTPLDLDPDPNVQRTDRRAVLDYVVAFNLDFAMASADPDGNYDTADPDVYTVGVWNGTETTVNSNPERVRAVRITLAVRTPEQDPRFAHGNLDPAAGPVVFFDQALCAGMRCFQVFNDRPGAARVRSLRAEVFLPNVALEGY